MEEQEDVSEEIVENEKGEAFKVPSGVHDMMSSAFYTRTIDMTQMEVGDQIAFMSFMDEAPVSLTMPLIICCTSSVFICSGRYCSIIPA